MFLYLLRAHSPIRSSVPIKPINNTCQFKLVWNAIISGQSFPFHPPLAHGLTKAFYRLKPLHSHSLHFMSNLPSSAFWHLFLGHHFYSWSFLFFSHWFQSNFNRVFHWRESRFCFNWFPINYSVNTRRSIPTNREKQPVWCSSCAYPAGSVSAIWEFLPCPERVTPSSTVLGCRKWKRTPTAPVAATPLRNRVL